MECFKNLRVVLVASEAELPCRRAAVTGQDIRDQVVPVLVLLQAAESHLGSGDVLLGVLEVGELEDAFVSIRVRKSAADTQREGLVGGLPESRRSR